jgi:proline iminopeptidase
LRALAKECRFHYYDQRGCGKSTRPVDTFSSGNMYANIKTLDKVLGLGAQIADVERIRRILGDEKLVVIGHSFGAFLAALYAAEFPERVDAMVLVTPADMLVMPQEGEDFFSVARDRLPEDLRADFDSFLEVYFDFGSMFQKSDADLAALNEELASYLNKAFEMPPTEPGKAGGWMVQGMFFSMGMRHDYRDALRHIPVPVLVVHGSEDLQSEAKSRVYADLIPNSRFTVIEGSRHFPFESHPAEFGAAVAGFLSESE